MKKSELMRAHAWTKGLLVSSRNEKMRDTVMAACLRLATVIDVVSGVNDVTGMPGEPCTLHSQNAVKKLRELLGTKAHQEKKAKAAKRPEQTSRAEEVDPASEMACGKPPYVAEIVRSSDGKLLTEVGRRYKTVGSAVDAVVKRAKVLKHRVNPMSWHWVTRKKEHMVDYGSHTFYGRITSNDKRKGK